MGPEDKSRARDVREASVRGPRAADQARGSYAFHDTERVDHLRPASARSMKPSRTAQAEAPPQTRPGEPESWPPMPSVPPELQGAAEAPRVSPAAEPSGASNADRLAAKLVGGVWEAVPSVIEGQPADNDEDPANRITLPEASGEERPENRIELTYLGRAGAQDSSATLGRFEPFVERGAWEQLAEELERLEERSPGHTLLYVIARREMRGTARQDIALTREAIGAVSQLLGVPDTSPTALLLSKRLLRRNPWNSAQKPTKKLSVSLMLIGVSLGAGVGWLATRFFM